MDISFNPLSDKMPQLQLELENLLVGLEESIYDIFDEAFLTLDDFYTVSSYRIVFDIEPQFSTIPKLMHKSIDEIIIRFEDLTDLEISGWFYYKGDSNKLCFEIKEF